MPCTPSPQKYLWGTTDCWELAKQELLGGLEQLPPQEILCQSCSFSLRSPCGASASLFAATQPFFSFALSAFCTLCRE